MKPASETATEIYYEDYTDIIEVADKEKVFNPLNYWNKHNKKLDLIAGISLAALAIYSLGVFLG